MSSWWKRARAGILNAWSLVDCTLAWHRFVGVMAQMWDWCVANCVGLRQTPVVVAIFAAGAWCADCFATMGKAALGWLQAAGNALVQGILGAWAALIVPCVSAIQDSTKKAVAKSSSSCLAWAVDHDPEAARANLLDALAPRSDQRKAVESSSDYSSDAYDSEEEEEDSNDGMAAGRGARPTLSQPDATQLPSPAKLPPPAQGALDAVASQGTTVTTNQRPTTAPTEPASDSEDGSSSVTSSTDDEKDETKRQAHVRR